MTKGNMKIMDLLMHTKDAAILKAQLREIFAPPAIPQSAQEWESEWGIILSGEYDQEKWLEAYYEQHKRNLLLESVWEALEWSNFKNLGAIMRKATREAVDGITRVWFMKFFEDMVPVYDMLWQFDPLEKEQGQYFTSMLDDYLKLKYIEEPIYSDTNDFGNLYYVYTEDGSYKDQAKEYFEPDGGGDLYWVYQKIRERDYVWYQCKRVCIDFTPEQYFKIYFWKLNEKYDREIESLKKIVRALWTVRSY